VNEETGVIRKATPLQIEKLIAHYAVDRAQYEEWHTKSALKYGDALPQLADPKPMPHLEALAA
jgi:hypothetical protein